MGYTAHGYHGDIHSGAYFLATSALADSFLLLSTAPRCTARSNITSVKLAVLRPFLRYNDPARIIVFYSYCPYSPRHHHHYCIGSACQSCFCIAQLRRGVSGEKMFRSSDTTHALLYQPIPAPLFCKVRMRIRSEVSGVFLLLTWLPQSLTVSSAQGEDNSRNGGNVFSLGPNWPGGLETGGVWPHSSADLHHGISANPAFDFTTIVRRRPDVSPLGADPSLLLGDLHSLSAFGQTQVNVPAADAVPYPYEFSGEGSKNEGSTHMWQKDTRSRSRIRSDTHKRKQLTAFGSTKGDRNRSKGKTAESNVAQPHKQTSPESPSSEWQEKKSQVLEKLFPLQHPRHYRMLLKGRLAALREELKVFDIQNIYGLALILSYLGLPTMSSVVAFGQLCRALLLGKRNQTHVARRHYYTTAAVLSQAKKLASLYLKPEAGKGTDYRKKREETQLVSEGKQQGKTEKRGSRATKVEQKEVENPTGTAEDAYGWHY